MKRAHLHRLRMLVIFWLASGNALAGWFGPSNAEECQMEYAAKAGTDQLTRWGIGWCAQAFDPAKHPIEQKRALCAAEQLPDLRSDMAGRLVYARCVDQHPTPDCESGHSFSFEVGRCIREITDPFDVKWQSPPEESQKNRLTPYDGPVVPNPQPAPAQVDWANATAQFERERADFLADPARRSAMQRAVDAVDAETGGGLPPAELLERAYQRAATQTGWLTVVRTTPDGRPIVDPFTKAQAEARPKPAGRPKPGCVFKPVMTDAEIAACRN